MRISLEAGYVTRFVSLGVDRSRRLRYFRGEEEKAARSQSWKAPRGRMGACRGCRS